MVNQSPPAPARLFVLLSRSRSAHVGVILRRGPSKWVQTILWDTKKDVFTPGQWFRGRIYEQKCDLSPNGKFIVYHAYQSGNRVINPAYGDAWTAVSKPPYFTALALWPHWNGYGGGGYFLKSNRMLLNHLDDNRTPHPKHQPNKNWEIVQADEYSHMAHSIYYHIQLRDGWEPIDRRGDTRVAQIWYARANYSPTLIKTKGKITLICHALGNIAERMDQPIHNYGSYNIVPKFQYNIRHQASDREFQLEGANWADFDHLGRIVFARNGTLARVKVTDQGELSLTELADFNVHKPEPVETPDWAKKW